jgi:hypothetical protein
VGISHPKKRRLVFLIALVLLAGWIVFGIGYIPHLLWRFGSNYRSMLNDSPVRIVSLIAKPTDDGFVRCHLGSVSILVPREMVSNREFRGKGRAVVFKHGDREIMLKLPSDDSTRIQQLQAELPRLGRGLSGFEIEVAMLRASSSDFRWDMTWDELEWHKWLVTYGGIPRAIAANGVELFSNGNIDGLLRNRAWFNWWAERGRVSGLMVCDNRKSQLDLDWVRPICASLQFTGEMYPETMSDDEVAKLFRVE